MKEFDVNDMELGNLIFGNSRGLYHVEPRMEYQDTFCKFLRRIGCDFEGCSKDGEEIDNDVFTLRPYYWGEDEEKADLPNFIYKPANIKISWYKYPMRDAYCNQNVSIKTFKAILKECEKVIENERRKKPVR